MAISSVFLTYLKKTFLKKLMVFIHRRRKKPSFILFLLWKPENWKEGLTLCNNLKKKRLSQKTAFLNSLRIQ